MITAKNPPRAELVALFEVGRKICDLRSDHSFDHLQVWTTWELWTLRHKKARFSDKKAPKSTQKEAKDLYCFLWEHDAAGSSPVTPTKTAALPATKAAEETLRFFISERSVLDEKTISHYVYQA